MSVSDPVSSLAHLYYGLIAVEQGWLTDRQLDDAIEIGRKMVDLGMGEDMAKILVRKNYLTEGQAEQVDALVDDRQGRDQDLLAARCALEKSVVSFSDLARALRVHRQDAFRRSFGETLVALGYIGEVDRQAVESAMRRHLAERAAEEASRLLAGEPSEVDGIPKQLGNYEIVEELSRGGMGVVYRARQRSLGRIVALKILSADLVESAEFIERFQREAKAIAEISHPNIVQIFDYGRLRGLHYIAMEFVDGESLESFLMRRGTLSTMNAAVIAESVARGLAEANSRGVIHRDVKPDNILLAKNGQIKLTDFGLAKMQTGPDEEDSGLTQRGSVMGSPYYIAPEQARGELVDFRVDMYSLGVTLFRTLVGQVPFDAPTSIQIIAKHLNAPVPPRSELPVEVPIPAYNLIKWLMAKKPEGRPESWKKVIELIREMREVPGASECPGCRHPLKPGDVICIQCGLNLKTGVRIQMDTGGSRGASNRRPAAKSSGSSPALDAERPPTARRPPAKGGDEPGSGRRPVEGQSAPPTGAGEETAAFDPASADPADAPGAGLSESRKKRLRARLVAKARPRRKRRR